MKRYRKIHIEKTVMDKGSINFGAPLGSGSSSHIDFKKLPKIGICIGCKRRMWDYSEV
jgi:hypothetical protein